MAPSMNRRRKPNHAPDSQWSPPSTINYILKYNVSLLIMVKNHSAGHVVKRKYIRLKAMAPGMNSHGHPNRASTHVGRLLTRSY